ncbi:MAG: hypothetical protein LBB10_00465 [Bifidobacteriaceae bacterium]|jgi:uncharacterized protein YukE|nr:hypothetical protein [Bifidobacteriaceae bacterium]
MILDSNNIRYEAQLISDLANRIRAESEIAYSSLENVRWKGDAGDAFKKSLYSHCLKLKEDANMVEEAGAQLVRHADEIDKHNYEEQSMKK